MTKFIGKGAHRTIRWAALLVPLIAVLASLLQAANVKPAFADTGGYPWWNAPCVWNNSTTGSCSGYDWGESTCPSGDGYCTSANQINGYYIYDQWGEGFRNCTSYAAWMLATTNGFTMPFHDYAKYWGTDAGTATNSTPAPGSIYVSTAGTYGHVAWVQNVPDSTHVTIEDYNSDTTGDYSSPYTVLTSSASGGYIHFKDLSSLSLTSGLTINAYGGYYVNAPISESFTVANNTSNSITAQQLILAVRDPYGVNYDQGCASNLTLAPGQSYACKLSQAWGSTGTYTVWPSWADTSGAWHNLASNQTFTLALPGQLEAISPLAITGPSGYFANVPVNEKFTVKNTTGGSLTVKELILAVRDPSNVGYDQLCAGTMTLTAGQTYACNLSQAWGSTGTYTVWADWLDTNNNWHQGQLGPNQAFTLVATPSIVASSPLVITAPAGYHVNTNINETFTVKNMTGASITLSTLELAVRDPYGVGYDQGCINNLVLSAGQSYTCTLSQAWGSTGTYTVWPDWVDANGNWHQGQLGPNQTFALAP